MNVVLLSGKRIRLEWDFINKKRKDQWMSLSVYMETYGITSMEFRSILDIAQREKLLVRERIRHRIRRRTKGNKLPLQSNIKNLVEEYQYVDDVEVFNKLLE